MKKVIKLMMTILLVIVASTCALLTVNATLEDELAQENQLTQTAYGGGIYVLSASANNIRVHIPKNYEFNVAGAQRWNELLESWVGVGGYIVRSNDEYDYMEFYNLDPSYNLYRIYIGDTAIFVHMDDEDTQYRLIISQDTEYMDSDGSIKIVWSNGIQFANRYHYYVYYEDGKNPIADGDISKDVSYAILPTEFSEKYDVKVLPVYGSGDDSYVYADNALKLKGIEPYFSVDSVNVSIENQNIEWTGRQVNEGYIKFKYPTRRGDWAEIPLSSYSVELGNTSLGKTHLTLTGSGHLVGTREVEYTIVKRDISNKSRNRVAGLTDQDYTGKQIKPNITFEILLDANGEWRFDTATLDDSNYDIEYGENIKGTGIVRVVGKNNCTGTYESSFEITGVGSIPGEGEEDEPTVKPAIPQIDISADNNTLTINFVSQTDADEFILYRSTNGKKYSKLSKVNELSYVDKKLTYGVKYYYKATACNKEGCSDYSSVVSKKVIPNKVENLKITSVSTTNVKLAWDRISVTGYEVYMGTKTSNMKKVTTISKNATITYSKSKLKANTTYYFKVKAYKKVGSKKVYGPWSDIVSNKTAPEKPKVSLSLKTDTEMDIKITAVKGASKYVLEKSEDGKNYNLLEELPAAGTISASNLKLNTTYYFRVQSCNSENNCSGWTISSKKQTLKIPGLSLKSYYKGQATINIGTIIGADGYAIEYSANSKKGFKEVISIDSSTNSYLHESSSLKSKKTYYYRVRAYKIVEGTKIYGPWSKVQKVKINTKVLVKLKSITLNVADKMAVNDTKNIVVTFNPANKVESINWESSDETIARVVDGKITGLLPGNVTITAVTSSGVTNSVDVIIYKPANSFTLSDTNIEMYIGDNKTISAIITPDDATFKVVSYKSLNSSVASVNNNGLISARSEGTTKVVASTEEGISRECTVTVKEKPIVYSGKGDSVITNINIPKGDYKATITFDSDDYNGMKLYYGEEDYEYDLLANETDIYSGTTIIESARNNKIENGILEVNTKGNWTISIEKVLGETSFPLIGSGSVVTGLFEGTGTYEIFDVTFDSHSYHGVYIYEYNGGYFDYDLLVNDVSNYYHGEVVTKTEKGAKYYLVIDAEGAWSINRKKISSTVTFPINGSGDYVTGLFDGTGKREILNVTFNADSYNSLTIYKYNGGYFDYDLLVNEADPYTGQVLINTEKGSKYFFVVETEGSWSISK